MGLSPDQNRFDEPEQSGEAVIDLDTSRDNVVIPRNSRVYLATEDTGYNKAGAQEMKLVAGRYEFKGQFEMEKPYRFLIEPPNGEPFYFPSGEQSFTYLGPQLETEPEKSREAEISLDMSRDEVYIPDGSTVYLATQDDDYDIAGAQKMSCVGPGHYQYKGAFELGKHYRFIIDLPSRAGSFYYPSRQQLPLAYLSPSLNGSPGMDSVRKFEMVEVKPAGQVVDDEEGNALTQKLPAASADNADSSYANVGEVDVNANTLQIPSAFVTSEDITPPPVSFTPSPFSRRGTPVPQSNSVHSVHEDTRGAAREVVPLDDLGGGKTTVFRKPSARPTPALSSIPTIPRAPRPAAPISVDIDDDSEGGQIVDIPTMRDSIAKDAKGVFALNRGLRGKDAIEQAQELHQRVVRFARDLGKDAEDADETALAALKDDAAAAIDEQHKELILTSTNELTLPKRRFLCTPEGRLLFRINAFNNLCRANKFGLTAEDTMIGKWDAEKVRAHMKKTLKGNFTTVEGIFSRYDAGNIRDALDEAVKSVEAEGMVQADMTLDSFKKRAKERAKLMGDLEGQIGKILESGNTQVLDSATKWGKTLEAGGDIALKVTAAAMVVYISPWLLLAAPVVGGARAITQALGYDFGRTMAKLVKAPVSLAVRGTKGIASFLPDSWKAKLPKGWQNWLDKPNAPTFEKIGRAKFPEAVDKPEDQKTAADKKKEGIRWRLLVRGLFPVPGLLDKIPYLKEMVPTKKLDVADKVRADRNQAEEDVQKACAAALENLGAAKQQRRKVAVVNKPRASDSDEAEGAAA